MGPDAALEGVSYDSRTLVPGQLFVPLVAERDGHDFVTDARRAGAPAVLWSRRQAPPPGVCVVVVDDTTTALADLGRWVRGRLPDRVVGITGSVGKTSVKDLARVAVGSRWITAASAKSLNNDWGLPSTIINAPDDTEALVLEMGMRGLGEIARLCTVARPTVGVVTRVAAAHTARVGGIEGVARAKGELVEALPGHGWAVLNADDERVAAMARRTAANVVTFGRDHGEVRVEQLVMDHLARARFVLATPWGSVPVRLAQSGAHMALNAAAAAAAALVLDADLEAVAAALATAELSPWRMEIHTTATGAVVINDAYNANPASMLAALEALVALPASRKVAVLGYMAELDDPSGEHLGVARRAREAGIELVAVGTDAYGVEPCADPRRAVGPLGPDVAVLVKASRVGALETFAQELVAEADSSRP